MTKNEIINYLKSNKQELSNRFGVQSIGLFGSYAREEQTEDSDIDIAVEIISDNKFRSFFLLKRYLEENLKKNIDLGIESTLKPVVKQYISKEIIYA